MDKILETIKLSTHYWVPALISAIVSIFVTLVTNYSLKRRQVEKFALDKKFSQYENLFQYYKDMSILAQKVKLCFFELYKFGINRPVECPEDEKYFNEVLSNATKMLNAFRDNIYYNIPFLPDNVIDKIISFYFVLQDATIEYMTNRNSYLKDRTLSSTELLFKDYVNLSYKQKIADAHNQLIISISSESKK